MKKRIDIMLDLETLGNDVDSTVFQIGAVAFDITSGRVLSEFNEYLDTRSISRTVSTPSTLRWWEKTNNEMFNKLITHPMAHTTEFGLYSSFEEWLIELADRKDVELYIWGNGLLFDVKMIEYQFNRFGLEFPIGFRNKRDVRTVVEIGEVSGAVVSKKSFIKTVLDKDEELHDALVDAKVQAKLISHIYDFAKNVI